MAAVPAAAATTAATPSTNYLSRYQTMPDVFNGDYTTLFGPFSPTSCVTPEDLFETVVKSANTVPKVFLAQVSINGDRKIVALHRPSYYEPDLADPAPQWDDKIFLFLGDLRPGSHFIQTVETPDSIFSLTDAQRVLNQASIDAAWAADQAVDILPALAATAANSEQVVTRRLFPVPWKYVPLVLGKSLSRREAWTTLSTAIAADNNQANCAPLLAWLRVASTSKSRNVADPATHIGDLPTAFPPIVDDAQLDRHRWAILTRDIPALLSPTPATSTSTEQVATILGAMRTDRATERAADEARRTAEKEDKLPSATKYKTVARDWMAFASVATETQLPPVYQQLVNSDKSEHLTILRNAVTLRARSAGAATNQVPIVSKETKEMVLSARFGVEDHELHDLSLGCQPFTMGLFAGDAHSKTIELRATQYDTMLNGLAAPTLGEQATFTTKEVRIPQDHFTASLMLASTSVQLDVLQGINHPFATAFRQFCLLHWPKIATTIHLAGRYQPDLEQSVIPRIMRWIQTHMVSYCRELILVGSSTPLPPFSDITAMIAHQQYNLLPNIPANYLATLPPAFPTPAAPYTPAERLFHEQQHDAKQPGQKTDKSTPTQQQKTKNPDNTCTPGRGGAMVTNPHVSSDWKAALERSSKKIRDIATNAPRSTDTDAAGNALPLCLSYHLRGSCYSNCNRAATHRELSATEQPLMAKFVTDNLE